MSLSRPSPPPQGAIAPQSTHVLLGPHFPCMIWVIIISTRVGVLRPPWSVRGSPPAGALESPAPQDPFSAPLSYRTLELSLELSRVSLERDSLSRELLRTIRQKVALTQELEAWQVRGGARGGAGPGRGRRGEAWAQPAL